MRAFAVSILAIVLLAGFGMVVMTKNTYEHFAGGWFPEHVGSLAKTHAAGVGLIVVGILLVFALIASISKHRGGPSL